jgi:hypothetical protein
MGFRKRGSGRPQHNEKNGMIRLCEDMQLEKPTTLMKENYWHNLKPDRGRFYETKGFRVVQSGWYNSLVFEGILTLTIIVKKGLYEWLKKFCKYKLFHNSP